MRRTFSSGLAMALCCAVALTSCKDEKTQEGSRAAANAAKKNDPAIQAADKFIAEQKVDKSKPAWRTTLTQPPKLPFDESKSYIWNLYTSKGTVRVKFMPDIAPVHVSSTIYLTQLGYFDGLKFHRVIPGFMAQGGCPLGTGSGGPGYEYSGEFRDDVKHTRGGLLSMANRGAGTDGSQFFLTFKATPWLDGKHTIFGEILDQQYMTVLSALEAAGTQGGTPTEPLSITRATISVE